MNSYNILRILNEAKEVGILYHYTTFKNLMNIIFENTLRGEYENYDAVSFTRRNDLHKANWSDKAQVRLVINGDKLSENYEIVPVQMTKSRFEAEEKVYRRIDNLDKYLLEINLLGYSAEDFAQYMKLYNDREYYNDRESYKEYDKYYFKYLGNHYLTKDGIDFKAVYNDFVSKYKNIIRD